MNILFWLKSVNQIKCEIELQKSFLLMLDILKFDFNLCFHKLFKCLSKIKPFNCNL